MTTHIPAGWTITRGTDDDGEYIDVTPPEGEAHGWRYYSEDWTTMQDRLSYRLAAALLDAAPAAPQQHAEPVADALDRIKAALPQFSQQDDYLLAHGASLMSVDSHEIIHIDTVRRIAAALAAPQPQAEPVNAEMREALRDMLSGWVYIRQMHGDLYGVGWDRAQGKAEAALSRAEAHHGITGDANGYARVIERSIAADTGGAE